jgi:hypothetical protein
MAGKSKPMNKHIKVSIKIELKEFPGERVLVVSFRKNSIESWCLGLCLLEAELIENLVVSEEGGKKYLEMRLRLTTEQDRIAHASVGNDASYIELTRDSLKYLRHFFLKYYRDGVAQVDHLDLEAIDKSTGRNTVNITFKVPDAIPPVSPEEAEARLRG